MSQYTVNNSTKSSNYGKAFDAWNSDTTANGRQLLTWMSPLSPGLQHWNIQERLVNHVGEWLLETKELKRWYAGSEVGEGESTVLFCYGDPGVGKTFISSLVVEWLCDQTGRQNTPVSCFYLDFAARREQSAANVLGSMLKQMVGGMERIPEEIWRTFQRQTMTIGRRRPQLVNIVKMLQCITSSRRAFMCLDALDECAGVERFRLLDSLKEIVEQSPGTRIFVTGRPHMRAEMESSLAGQVTSVSIRSTGGDIMRYLRFRLRHDGTPDAMDERLKAEILEKIPKNMSEMLRLVSLNIEAILQEPTVYRRRERLNKMTDGLGWGDAYSTTIERIKAQDAHKSRLGMAALMWLSHAERPLRADELCHALAVELGSKYFYADNAPSISTLVGCCQGLITVDKETSAVRFIHPTVKEYLSTRPDIFNKPHAAMSEICLTYLNSEQVKALSAGPSAVIHDNPFLEYCSVYWGIHAKRDLSDHARSLTLELLREYDGHISSKLLLKQVKYLDRRGCDGNFSSDLGSYVSFPFSGLDCASFFGIVKVVDILMRMECYTEERGARVSTPLVWATRNGHEEVVEKLYWRPGSCVRQGYYCDPTPLSYAIWCGQERVAERLLSSRMFNADMPDGRGKTPLSYAAQDGLERVVKILLEEQIINPDKPDFSGQTPLSFASRGGHVRVVKMLLGQYKVNPDKPDNNHQTPLSYAASSGHEEVVKILLGRDVDPDKPDNNHQTPLSYAASSGHEGIVKVLLGRKDVNPDKPDNDGRTPLMCATLGGHEGVVKILLGREKVNPNKPDNNGQTPLMVATLLGFLEVITLLQSHEDETPAEPEA